MLTIFKAVSPLPPSESNNPQVTRIMDSDATPERAIKRRTGTLLPPLRGRLRDETSHNVMTCKSQRAILGGYKKSLGEGPGRE